MSGGHYDRRSRQMWKRNEEDGDIYWEGEWPDEEEEEDDGDEEE
jgi:hypothetical protein